MLTVRELMRTDPLTLAPEESLRSAIDVLVSAGTGGAPVVSGSRLVGVISLSDVLAFEADAPGIPSYRPEMESTDDEGPLDGGEVDEAEEGGRWFREMWDGVGSVVARLATSDGPEWDDLDEHSVAEVMTRKVVAVAPGDPVEAAARTMDRAGIHRLLVLDRGELVGVLGARDVVRAVAKGLLVPAQAALPAAV